MIYLSSLKKSMLIVLIHPNINIELALESKKFINRLPDKLIVEKKMWPIGKKWDYFFASKSDLTQIYSIKLAFEFMNN